MGETYSSRSLVIQQRCHEVRGMVALFLHHMSQNPLQASVSAALSEYVDHRLSLVDSRMAGEGLVELLKSSFGVGEDTNGGRYSRRAAAGKVV